MSDNTFLAIILSVLMLFIFAREACQNHEEGLIVREIEKTKQLHIQARMDSIKTITINKQL